MSENNSNEEYNDPYANQIKSNRLLKDIYLYSKMCNINIQHEK